MTPSASPVPSSPAQAKSPTAQEVAAIMQAWRQAPSTVSATLYDSSTEATVSLHPGVRAYAASTVKVPILLAALQAASSGSNEAQSAVTRDAAPMIERSDNDAATRIWRAAGGADAVRSLTRALGMSQTTSAPILLEPWDGVQTSARDLCLLLRRLMSPSPPVTAAEARTTLGLMADVESDQAWGVPAGLSADDRAVVKNGWVPVPGHGWTVSSIGIVQHGNRYYCLAVVTTDNPSMAAGIRAVETVTRTVAAHLG